MVERDQFYVELGARVRANREKMGLTQAELADGIGISRTSLTNIESGRQRILADQLVDLSQQLSASLEELVPNKKIKVRASRNDLSDMPLVANFIASVLNKSPR